MINERNVKWIINSILFEKSIRKPKEGDYIEIDGCLCLLVHKKDWKYKLCKRKLAVVLLKYATGDDWMELGHDYQRWFEEGNFEFIDKKEAIKRLSK